MIRWWRSDQWRLYQGPGCKCPSTHWITPNLCTSNLTHKSAILSWRIKYCQYDHKMSVVRFFTNELKKQATNCELSGESPAFMRVRGRAHRKTPKNNFRRQREEKVKNDQGTCFAFNAAINTRVNSSSENGWRPVMSSRSCTTWLCQALPDSTIAPASAKASAG